MIIVTRWVMICTVVAVLIYDAYALYAGGLHATISWQFVGLSEQYPFIPFMFGVLAGHLTTQMKEK